MSVTGPDFLALQVRDVAAAADFYEQHVGLSKAPASPPGAVLFATQPIPFAVREPLPGVDLGHIDQLGAGVALWMHAEDPDGLHARLREIGTPILQPPFNGPFGMTFSFRDPEGYAITVHGER